MKDQTVAIYLVLPSLAKSICLPAGIGRAALNRLLTGHFSTQGLPIPYVTRRNRALLPHVFTLTLTSAGEAQARRQTTSRAVIFCGACCLSFESPPVRWCVALRCPDFPPFAYKQRQRRPVVCAKVSINIFPQFLPGRRVCGFSNNFSGFLSDGPAEIRTLQTLYLKGPPLSAPQACTTRLPTTATTREPHP